MNRSAAPPPTESRVRVRYETTEAPFASQFLVNASAEEVVINFSPGFIADPVSGETLMPVHSRVALTPGGALRLMNTLAQAVQNFKAAQGREQTAEAQAAALPKVKLGG